MAGLAGRIGGCGGSLLAGFPGPGEPADHGDWLLTPMVKSAARQQHGPVRDYEQRLLDGLTKGGGESHPSSLADSFGKVLDETRKALIHDAVRQGWLRHLRHGQRTAKGEELAGHLRSFRRGR